MARVVTSVSSILQESLDGCILLPIEVQPNASRDAIIGVNEWRSRLQVAVKAQPQKGAANKAVIRILGEIIGIPTSDIEITQGHTSRQKMVRVRNMSEKELSEAIKKSLIPQ